MPIVDLLDKANYLPTETVKERLEVCGKCRHKMVAICQKCGCILSLKAQLSTEKCPLGKWAKTIGQKR